MNRRFVALALAWALLATTLSPIAPTGTAAATNHATTLTECGTVGQPGDYAIAPGFDGSVAANDAVCLDIRASDVTIDGQDNPMAASANQGWAIYAARQGSDNLTVRNVTFEDWGVGIKTAENTTIDGVTMRNVSTGVDILAFGNSTVHDSLLVGVHTGISVDQSTGNTIENVTVEGGTYGVNVYGTDEDVATTVIRNSTIKNASKFGLSLRGNLNGSVIEDITLSGASEWDLRAREELGTATVRNLSLPNMTVIDASGGYFNFRAVRDLPDEPDGTNSTGIYANVTGTNAAARANLTIAYDDTVDESNLTVWRYHDGAWINETANASIDTAANTVAIDLTEFSILAPMERAAGGSGDGGGGVDVTDIDLPEIEARLESTPTPTATPTATPTEPPTRAHTPTRAPETAQTTRPTATAAETATATGTAALGQTATPGQPGFGVVVAVVALLAGLLLAQRRK